MAQLPRLRTFMDFPGQRTCFRVTCSSVFYLLHFAAVAGSAETSTRLWEVFSPKPDVGRATVECLVHPARLEGPVQDLRSSLFGLDSASCLLCLNAEPRPSNTLTRKRALSPDFLRTNQGRFSGQASSMALLWELTKRWAYDFFDNCRCLNL